MKNQLVMRPKGIIIMKFKLNDPLCTTLEELIQGERSCMQCCIYDYVHYRVVNTS